MSSQTLQVQVQVRTMPRGSWKWQDAFSVRLVECPVGEAPDCRRRGHRLIAIVAKKTAHPSRYTEMAQARADELNATK